MSENTGAEREGEDSALLPFLFILSTGDMPGGAGSGRATASKADLACAPGAGRDIV